MNRKSAFPNREPPDREDFEAMLAYSEVLDISRKNFEMLYLELIGRAEEKAEWATPDA